MTANLYSSMTYLVDGCAITPWSEHPELLFSRPGAKGGQTATTSPPAPVALFLGTSMCHGWGRQEWSAFGCSRFSILSSREAPARLC